MKNHVLAIATAGAIGLFAVAAVAQTAPADVTAEYTGVITRIDAGDVVVLKVSDKEVSISTDSKTVVVIDGKEDKAMNLARNMSATVRTINGTAVRIEATTPLRPVQ